MQDVAQQYRSKRYARNVPVIFPRTIPCGARTVPVYNWHFFVTVSKQLPSEWSTRIVRWSSLHGVRASSGWRGNKERVLAYTLIHRKRKSKKEKIEPSSRFVYSDRSINVSVVISSCCSRKRIPNGQSISAHEPPQLARALVRLVR